jgi:ABC-type oligopeptide transport system substrate-binding subunit/DNA-binding SARP family transcriptional activator
MNSQESLKIFTLGGLSIQRGAKPVTGFASRKVEALLVYLACTKHPQPREVLAELLWDERSQDRAMGNLRVVLTSLRKLLNPYIIITRDSVSMNLEEDIWLDVSELESMVVNTRQVKTRPLTSAAVQDLEQAATFYKGRFLDGFYVRECAGFENWMLSEQERLQRVILDVYSELVTHYTSTGDYKLAIKHATRLLEIDPLMEEAHRQMMMLLAFSGQRGAALKQYETCLQLFDSELGVEPTEATTNLYRQIQNGELHPPDQEQSSLSEVTQQPPAFLEADQRISKSARPVFVGREHKLQQLNDFLANALSGQGQVVFITGEAGSGKTALISEFAQRAQETYADLIVALGNCSDYTGAGDPYLPFRDVMSMLTGDVETRWASSAITQVHARRLWSLVPFSVNALMTHGTDLIDAFVPATELFSRATAVTPATTEWLAQLKLLTERQRSIPENIEQSNLFEQYTNVLHALAAQQPLLIMLDDLHWADAASVNLLFHLGREITGSAIMILGTYRPEEVSLGRNNQRHPLEKVTSEFKRQFGDIWVNLDETEESENLDFVESYIDTEPNKLDSTFRQALLNHTGGHPLFTIELIRDLQRRGDLVKDEQNRWVEGTRLDWDVLPARVEGVIEERIGRLEPELHETLSVASVIGVNFSAQVINWVRNINERQLVGQLSRELDKKHHLVEELGVQTVGDWRLYSYRFRHKLFQQHLYNEIGDIERKLLHAEIGLVLESLYGENVEQISAQLAWHFTEAGEYTKAVHYLLMTGDRARQLYAHDEATDNYQRALRLLKENGDYEQAARTLMKIGLTYHTAFDFVRSRQAYDEGFSLFQRSGKQQIATDIPPANETVRLDWESDPVTLDPNRTVDRPTSQLLHQVFSGLLDMNPDFGVVPDMAKSWEVTEGGRKYIFLLRDDVFWSDGIPVTADDFVCSWLRVLDPNNTLTVTTGLYDVKGGRAFKRGEIQDPDQVGVHALDPYTLEVELEGPTGFFPYLLTQPLCLPVPKHIIDQHGDSWQEIENFVSNGPFLLTSWQPGERLILERNPRYHGQFSGNIQRMELLLINDPEDRLQLYEADGLEVIRLEPAIDYALRRHSGEYISGPSLISSYLRFKVDTPPFTDHRVRQAFVMAINRETLASVVLKGYHAPAMGGFVPPGIPGYSAGIGLPFNPDTARQILAQAGYPEGRGLPEIEMTANFDNQKMAEFISSQLKTHLNVSIKVNIHNWGDFLNNLDVTHLLLARWVADYPDPDNFLRVALDGRIGHWDDEYIDLLEKARRLTNQENRMKLYHQADKILVEKAAIMPVTYARFHLLVKPWVKNLAKSSLDFWTCKNAILQPFDSGA